MIGVSVSLLGLPPGLDVSVGETPQDHLLPGTLLERKLLFGKWKSCRFPPMDSTVAASAMDTEQGASGFSFILHRPEQFSLEAIWTAIKQLGEAISPQVKAT